jgi:signal peptide peptidase-like protein 2B
LESNNAFHIISKEHKQYVTLIRLLTPTMFKLLISLFFGALIRKSEAILPTGGIEVQCADGTCSETLLASQASFDTWPEMNPENNAAMLTVFPPDSDPLLCLGTEQTTSYPKSPFVIVAPRGLCTFEQKAVTAQNLGASGIIIYGTLASRYSLNTTQIAANDNKVTSDDVIYPAEFHDYDCDKASADIPTSQLSFDKKKLPYDSSRNDPLLTGTLAQGNLCAVGSTNFTESCPSERCLLTGKLENNGQSMKACCAWDFHIWLYKDENITADIKIPAFYITMEESDSLLQYMNSKQVRVTMYRRYYPKYNLSSIVIWGLGVFVAGLAAWLSASDYRHAKKINQNATEEMQPMDRSESNNVNGYAQIQGGSMMQEESLELSASHACGFIVFSTAGLLTLFIFKIYNVVKVFYAFGCCGAISQVVFYPLFCRLAAKIGFRDRTAFVTDTMEIGAVSYVGLFATVVSYGLGTVWTIIAFTQPHPDNILFFWVMQDLMGACMCILFLSTIKVNSIKVATVLLTAAFFYDIFFVFLTPLLTKGGKSIMVDVATSGGKLHRPYS